MNLSQRKALDIAVRNGYKVTMQDALDMFFLPEDQDAFARSLGWEDAEQMLYYDNLAAQEQALHELQNVDAREVYEEPVDMAGVY